MSASAFADVPRGVYAYYFRKKYLFHDPLKVTKKILAFAQGRMILLGVLHHFFPGFAGNSDKYSRPFRIDYETFYSR